MDIGGEALHHPRKQIMTTATAYSRFSPSIPAGVEFNAASNAYWVRADFYLTRGRKGWVLTDADTVEERFFRTEAAGLAALAALV
jgi:hypothetical protein